MATILRLQLLALLFIFLDLHSALARPTRGGAHTARNGESHSRAKIRQKRERGNALADFTRQDARDSEVVSQESESIALNYSSQDETPPPDIAEKRFDSADSVRGPDGVSQQQRGMPEAEAAVSRHSAAEGERSKESGQQPISKSKQEGTSAPGLAVRPTRPAEQKRKPEDEDEEDVEKLDIFDLELVIARVDENLAWLARVPSIYRATIYNKGGVRYPMPGRPKGWVANRQYRVVNLTNVGGEANSFAEHLVRNYDSLAQYTIFCHGDPFAHNKLFMQLLAEPTQLLAVQTMSTVYTYDTKSKYYTPREAVEAMQKNVLYRSERTITRTLNAAWYNDEGSYIVQKNYRNVHNLPQGANLIRHHLSLLGLADWMPEAQEVCSFAFGGMVGFDRQRAKQHPKRVYELLLKTTTGSPHNSHVIERVWLVLFGGPNFED